MSVQTMNQPLLSKETDLLANLNGVLAKKANSVPKFIIKLARIL